MSYLYFPGYQPTNPCRLFSEKKLYSYRSPCSRLSPSRPGIHVVHIERITNAKPGINP